MIFDMLGSQYLPEINGLSWKVKNFCGIHVLFSISNQILLMIADSKLM